MPDKDRITDLKTLFISHKANPEFVKLMRSQYGVDLVFHASEGKKPYGYTVIDHASKQVFKGSEILNLKYLLDESLNLN